MRASSPARSSSSAPRRAALTAYEAVRNPATAKVVLTNRSDPPDAILREVWQRSGGQRFERIEDVISTAELAGDPRPLQEGRGLRPRDAARRGRASSEKRKVWPKTVKTAENGGRQRTASCARV